MEDIDSEKLKLIKDIPCFGEEYDSGKDKFNHKVYAEKLFEIIRDNEGPQVIGLIGPWGTGKSTILNLLKNKVNGKREDYKYVYFNAWKYSHDFFRREFLLASALKLMNYSAAELRSIYPMLITIKVFPQIE